MPLWTLIVIAIGLSADAFAVAIGKGLQLRRIDLRTTLAVALTFGGFQAVMPLVGWLAAPPSPRPSPTTTTGSRSGCCS